MNVALNSSRFEFETSQALPLVVDLDGTLVQSDLLYESFFDAVSRHGHRVLSRGLPLSFSKEGLKSRLAQLSEIDYGALPYNERVLQVLIEARAQA